MSFLETPTCSRLQPLNVVFQCKHIKDFEMAEILVNDLVGVKGNPKSTSYRKDQGSREGTMEAGV